jgi:hypothetical protein
MRERSAGASGSPQAPELPAEHGPVTRQTQLSGGLAGTGQLRVRILPLTAAGV